MAEEKKVPNLKAKYQQEVAPALMQKFGYKSTLQIPKLDKIVVNCGCGEARDNSKVLEAVVGDFNDPAKAKEIALSMYNRGADFVQHIAGASGMGVFTAAKEADRYAFGVGGNQNYIEPDYIVATALRDVNTIVYNEIKALVEGTWEPGVHISGIAEGSVGFDNTDSNVVLPDDIAAAVEDIKAKITAGELVPCETAEELDAWVAANQYQPAE